MRRSQIFELELDRALTAKFVPAGRKKKIEQTVPIRTPGAQAKTDRIGGALLLTNFEFKMRFSDDPGFDDLSGA